jgi:hypothetical protein
MANSGPPRGTVETHEYTAQYFEIIRRHSADVMEPVITGLTEAIGKSPRVMERLTGNIWMAKSKNLGLTVPRVRIFFSIEGNPPDDEHILLLWIEEISTTDEIVG